jgi:hypothetical protein
MGRPRFRRSHAPEPEPVLDVAALIRERLAKSKDGGPVYVCQPPPRPIEEPEPEPEEEPEEEPEQLDEEAEPQAPVERPTPRVVPLFRIKVPGEELGGVDENEIRAALA